MIEIDGSFGEGGGQIARTALALSTLTGKPFRIFDIRKNRPEPGLKAQHLTAVDALRQICDAKTNEVAVGSTELRYIPGKIRGGAFSFDIGTAGSISLLLQALLPPVMFGPKKTTITITGGTCGKWQTPVEYFQSVLLPQVQRFCKQITCTMTKRGYYPKGGGSVTLDVKPLLSLKNYDTFDTFLFDLRTKVKPFALREQGELMQIKGVSHAAQELAPRQVAERQADVARMMLQGRCATDIQAEYQNTLSAGSGITLWARFNLRDELHTILGADVLGGLGKRSEDVGREAAEQLISMIDARATVDGWMADQILPFMALAFGSVVAPAISDHSRTNMDVIEKFLPIRFKLDQNVISTME